MDQQPDCQVREDTNILSELPKRERGRAGFTQLPPNPTRGTSLVSITPDVPLAPVSWHTRLLPRTPSTAASPHFCLPLSKHSNTSAKKKQQQQKKSFTLIKPYCLKTKPKHPACLAGKKGIVSGLGKYRSEGGKVKCMLILEEHLPHPTGQVEVLLHS